MIVGGGRHKLHVDVRVQPLEAAGAGENAGA
jgi:hypothetical protein